MGQITMTVEKREQFGKNVAGRLRRAGRIPGVLYGDGKPPVALTLEPSAIEQVLHSERGVNTIFDLELAGAGLRRPAMIHEIQRHPITQKLVHADFVRINMEHKVHVRVSIVLSGIPKGVKLGGGIVDFSHREVGIECLPIDIPAEIVVDVSDFDIGRVLKVTELPFDLTKVKILDDPATVVALVALPAAEKTETGASDEATEPVVAGKGGAAADPAKP